MRLDNIDIKILGTLQRDGRLSNLELAEQVSLSPSACHRRVKLLEEGGYIESYQAILNAKKVGYEILAIVEINLTQINEADHNYFTNAIVAMTEVVNAYIVTGESNYILLVRTRDFEEFSQFIVNKINKLKGISKIHSQIVLSELKFTGKTVPI